MITDPIILTETDIRQLERVDIITFKGISGKFATVTQAKAAPQIVQAHSSAGQTFDVAVNGDTFILTPTS